jgi:2-oxo-4-hydroxy-4-carboxy-5-ureidoimidazoline decarboxylase
MPVPPLTLAALNAMAPEAFVAALTEVFEHAPWVAEAVVGGRPCLTVAALHDAMIGAVRNETAERQLAFISGHPELGSRVGQAAGLTDASQSEQGSLGLNSLSADEFATFSRLNQAYRDKFRFPFIICVRRHTRDSILHNFERRLGNGVAAERAQALTEIGLITRLRLNALVDGPGKPITDGRLSTHALDVTTGRPVPGIKVTLHEIGGSARGLIAEAVTNTDGRTDKPLISGEPLRIGTYELTFQVGGYFQAGFLDAVPIRFGIAEPEGHYHVPLLVTPWSYTTYRGS